MRSRITKYNAVIVTRGSLSAVPALSSWSAAHTGVGELDIALPALTEETPN